VLGRAPETRRRDAQLASAHFGIQIEHQPCGLISRISVSRSLPNEIKLRRIDGWPKIAAGLSQHAKVAA
jgi:hypothetical protein